MNHYVVHLKSHLNFFKKENKFGLCSFSFVKSSISKILSNVLNMHCHLLCKIISVIMTRGQFTANTSGQVTRHWVVSASLDG